jgi:hypothetical protein
MLYPLYFLVVFYITVCSGDAVSLIMLYSLYFLIILYIIFCSMTMLYLLYIQIIL